MAKQCDLCGRGPKKDATRSHSNIRTNKRQYVNLQSRKVSGGTVQVCTRCLRTMAKVNK